MLQHERSDPTEAPEVEPLFSRQEEPPVSRLRLASAHLELELEERSVLWPRQPVVTKRSLLEPEQVLLESESLESSKPTPSPVAEAQEESVEKPKVSRPEPKAPAPSSSE